MRFENGVVIELLSATELIKLNIPFDENRIIPKGIQSKSDSKFNKPYKESIYSAIDYFEIKLLKLNVKS